MPSASVVHSFPVPLGRRGTAAAVVLGIHALLVVALVSGLTAKVGLTRPDDTLIGTLVPPEAIPQPPLTQPKIDLPTPAPIDQDPFDIPQVVLRGSESTTGILVPQHRDPPADPAPVVTTPGAGPKILSSTEPLYPSAARRMGQEGSVLLRVRVDALGRPEAIEVARTSGFSLLDAAALDAVRRWRFVPAQAEGRAISAWVTFTVTFRLTER